MRPSERERAGDAGWGSPGTGGGVIAVERSRPKERKARIGRQVKSKRGAMLMKKKTMGSKRGTDV